MSCMSFLSAVSEMSDVMEFVNCAKMESDNKITALRISKHHKTSLLHEYQMEVSIELFCALTLASRDVHLFANLRKMRCFALFLRILRKTKQRRAI